MFYSICPIIFNRTSFIHITTIKVPIFLKIVDVSLKIKQYTYYVFSKQ